MFNTGALPLIQAGFLPIKQSAVLQAKIEESRQSLDIYTICCTSFRDAVIWPHRQMLQDVFTRSFSSVEYSVMGTDVIHRVNQMCAVLVTLGPKDHPKHKSMVYLLGLLVEKYPFLTLFLEAQSSDK